MKQYIKIYLCLVLSSLVLSCAKDNGNYNYTDIPRITFEDADYTGKIFIRQGEKLKLEPTVHFDGNADDLEYEWFVYLNSASASYIQDSTLIATTRTLDYIVDPEVFTIGEDYKLTYKVTNKQNDLSYFYFYQLTVSDLFTVGWMFLEDKQNEADLSMILNDGTIYRSIYSERNSDHPISNPKSFTISSRSISDGVGPDGKKYYVVGEEDAIELDGTTMRRRFEYDFLFFTPPSVTKPNYIAWGGANGNNLGLLVNDGQLHANFVGGFPGAKKFSAGLQSPNYGYEYKLAPQHVSGNEYGDTYNIIMYDQQNQCFYDVSYDALKQFDAAAIDLEIFDMNDVGLNLVKLDFSNIIEIRNAIMKDDNGTGYLLQFRMHRTAEQPLITVNKQILGAPGITKSVDVACSTLSPHIYYVSDGKLYRYEVTSDTYVNEYALPTGEELTKIAFQRDGYGDAQPRLVVYTWNGTEGKVYYFKVNANGSVGELDKTYTGFGKIIDLAYKN